MKPTGTQQKRPRKRQMSGFHVMKAALSRQGLGALDGRSAAARGVSRWKAEVLADLGGDLSTAQLTLLEAAASDLCLLAVADGYLRELGAEVVSKRKRQFVPLVEQRLRVAAHLAATLEKLGLQRRPPPPRDIREVIAEADARYRAEQRQKAEDERKTQATAPASTEAPSVEPEPNHAADSSKDSLLASGMSRTRTGNRGRDPLEHEQDRAEEGER